ncbi:ATP-binding protein [Streptomyces sp. NBC_00249]|uniref:ATP-binding protein n=1 Tax=Streptomyces sp. NBC_00249 TaxID=2975690 RepID=UPI00225783AF|nr:ATP-binding protein [Streptomyces sp. NBC_00249]MCX5195517.1 ATP-binding protein [Streptomyces sp. NBC_00249]
MHFHPTPTLTPHLHVDLDGSAAAADARHAARSFLAPSAHGQPAVPPVALDATLLVISELVTNAVRHTAGGCALDLQVRPDGVDVDVTDTSNADPRPRPPDRRGEGGWGWHLVNRLGTDVEIRHHAVRGGKTIHVHVPHASPRAG